MSSSKARASRQQRDGGSGEAGLGHPIFFVVFNPSLDGATKTQPKASPKATTAAAVASLGQEPELLETSPHALDTQQ